MQGAIGNALPSAEDRGKLDGPIDPNWGLTFDGVGASKPTFVLAAQGSLRSELNSTGLPVGDEPPAAAAKRGEDFCAAVPDKTFGAPSVRMGVCAEERSNTFISDLKTRLFILSGLLLRAVLVL